MSESPLGPFGVHLARLAGLELVVTQTLPFDATNAAGEPLGKWHWVPMFDKLFVSQECFDWIKENVPSVGD